MAKNKGRRGRASKRSLPTHTLSTSQKRDFYQAEATKWIQRKNPELYQDLNKDRSRDRIIKRGEKVKRQLAKPQISSFPKTYTNALMAYPIIVSNDYQKPISICEQRSVRTQVLHATGKTGKKGQRTPRWTQKSKVRC